MIKSKSLVAGTVILYNPLDNVYDNIMTFHSQVSMLFVVDNSIQYNTTLIRKLSFLTNIIYINNNGNQGIADALNKGCNAAMDYGFEFILTMDQDTSLSENFVNLLMQTMESDSRSIGIVAPQYENRDKETRPNIELIQFTMTSGNILNLNIYKKVGPFLNELFIDHVDHEYCLRINKNGYKVVQVNSVKISHRPGRVISFRLLSKRYKISSHSPSRLYYFCRNGFYVSRLYKANSNSFKQHFIQVLVKEILKIPFENLPLTRLRLLWRGYVDFRNRKFGPLKINH